MFTPRSHKSPPRKRRGFTLLELVVAVVILTILSALAIPTFQSVINSSTDATTQASLHAIGNGAAYSSSLQTPRLFSYDHVAAAISSAGPSGTHVLAGTAPTYTDSFSTPSTITGASASGDGLGLSASSPGTTTVSSWISSDSSTLITAMLSPTGNCATEVVTLAGGRTPGLFTPTTVKSCSAQNAPGYSGSSSGSSGSPGSSGAGSAPDVPTGVIATGALPYDSYGLGAHGPGPPVIPMWVGGQVHVSWTAPSGGTAPTGYQVSASPGSGSCTTTGALTCDVNGLTNGTSYSFTVQATNASGPSVASTSASATPIGGIGAPSNVVITTYSTLQSAPSGTTDFTHYATEPYFNVMVTWDAPATNGATLSDYSVGANAGQYGWSGQIAPTDPHVAYLFVDHTATSTIHVQTVTPSSQNALSSETDVSVAPFTYTG